MLLYRVKLGRNYNATTKSRGNEQRQYDISKHAQMLIMFMGLGQGGIDGVVICCLWPSYTQKLR